MAYNNNKGPQHSGDIQFEGDPDDTQIDFENDSITLKTGGSARVVVNNTGLSGSGTLQSVGPTILGNTLAVSGTVSVTGDIVHAGDTDTLLRFENNSVNLIAGDKSAIKLDTSVAQIRLNHDAENLDTQIIADDGTPILHADAGTNRVGINTTLLPTDALTVVGNISGSGTLQAVGATTLGNTLNVSGTVFAAGAVSASSFHGDGSRLQNITGTLSAIANGADNRVVTFSSADALNGEANLTFDGSVLGTRTLSASLGVTAEDIALISNTPNIFLSNSAGTGLGFVGYNTSDNLLLQNNVTNKHIVFKTNDAGSMKEGLRINGAVPEVVVNEGSDSLVNFRVESNSNTHMIFVDGSENTVGINTSNPSHTLEVSGSYLLSGSARSSYTNRPQAGGYTILDTDNVIIFNNAGTQVATLPRITTSNQGVMYYIKNIGAGAVTLTGSATFEQFIDGQQTLSLTQGDSAKVIGHGLGTGFGWSILSYYNV
tara:strand:- start:1064 stop:2521 length:1458 start_codon:yes stop_codon:yes gene_type:complete